MNRPLILLSFFLFTHLAQSLELTAPKKGDQTASVQILPSPTLPHSIRFMANQMALFSTGTILNPASKKCGVPTKAITASLKIEQIRGSDLVTISSLHEDKEKRHLIVRAVFNSYLAHRKRMEVTLVGEKLRTLDQEIATQDDLVNERRKSLTVLIQKYGVPTSGAGPSSVEMTKEEVLKTAHTKLADIKAMKDQIEIRLKKISELKGLELLKYCAGLDLPGNQVAVYFEKHREVLDQRLDMIAGGLGETHPKIKVLDAKAERLIQNGLSEVVTVRETEKTKLELVSRQVEKMAEQAENHKNELSLRDEKFRHMKEAYELERKKFDQLKAQREELLTSLKNNHYAILHGWE